MATPDFTTPTTWAAGNVPTAAQFNAQLRDNVLHLATPVACQATRTTNLSIPNSTSTAITFTSTDSWDTDSIHSTSTNPSRFTIPTGQDGIYWCYCDALFAVAGGTIRYLAIYKNGSALVTTPGHLISATQPFAAVFSTEVWGGREVLLAAGDYIEFHAFQDSGGAINITNAIGSIRKVSE